MLRCMIINEDAVSGENILCEELFLPALPPIGQKLIVRPVMGSHNEKLPRFKCVIKNIDTITEFYQPAFGSPVNESQNVINNLWVEQVTHYEIHVEVI